MRTFLSILGPLVGAVGLLPYIMGTVKGQIRPRIASWATWSLVTGIATIAAASEHAWASVILTGIATCMELTVLTLAFRNGDHDYNWVDGASQAVSLFGIVAWLLSRDPMFAIIFNIVADLFGAVPTLYHAWLAPHEEAWLPFVLSGAGAAVSCMAVESFSFVAAGFPVYLTIIGFVLGLSIYARQKVVRDKKIATA